jgi:hypothetical protein
MISNEVYLRSILKPESRDYRHVVRTNQYLTRQTRTSDFFILVRCLAIDLKCLAIFSVTSN